MKETKKIKIYTRVTRSEFVIINRIVKDYRFRSVYSLLYTLLSLFVRYKISAEIKTYNDDINEDIREMFDGLSSGVEKFNKQTDATGKKR